MEYSSDTVTRAALKKK